MPSGRTRPVVKMYIFVSCQTDAGDEELIPQLSQFLKFHSLIPLKRNFMKYFFIGYQSGKWSKNFLN